MNKKVLAITLMAFIMLALQISEVYVAKAASPRATMTLSVLPPTATSETDGDIDITWVPRDTSEYRGIPDAESTDPSYFLWDGWGGTWSDAEKRPPHDSVGNPPPLDPGEEDDLMCWAAVCSNVLEWTGWGLVSGMWNSDQMFQHFLDHWYDDGGKGEYGWQWWFDGTAPSTPPGSYVDVAGGGDYWDPPYHFVDYWTQETTDKKALEAIDQYLDSGRGVYLSVNGHAITCWGFSYDSTDPDYYTGIYVTDSDDDKGSLPPAPNALRYYEVEYNSGDERWYLQNYYGTNTAYIHRVEGLMHFPSARPVADAGGPYVGHEGSAINFDGSGSTDADGDPLQYRWDFDNDGAWDTGWSTSATASNTWYDNYVGTVTVQVYDGHMLDVDSDTVTVINVCPTVNAGPDQTVYSGDTVSFGGSFTDPGTLDTHTIKWYFGDGTQATGTLTPTHVYLVAQVYTVFLLVTDDDGGAGSDTLTVTVERIPVPIDIKPGSYPNSINPFSKGVIPVAILNDASWTPYYIDPTLVDPSSAVFGPNKASPVRWAYEDVDLDGDIDLILFFKAQETGITEADTSATLDANLIDGRQITGVDSILAAPRKKP